MKKLIYFMSIFTLIFTACEEPTQEWIDKYDDMQKDNDAAYLYYKDRTQLSGSYTLTDDDYANSSNSGVSDYKNFSKYAPVKDNLPEILAASYYAEAGVELTINYNYYRGSNDYVGTYDVFIEYTLEDADYDAMGDGPGKYNNFSSYDEPGDYLPAFLATKYASEAEETVAKVFYQYYAGTTVTRSSLYILLDSEWVELPNSYELVDDDYDAMGDGPGKYNNFSSSVDKDDYLPVFLKLKYPYAKAEDVVTVVYKYYAGGDAGTQVRGAEYVFDGTAWAEYASTIEKSSLVKFNLTDKWIVVPPIAFVATDKAHTKEYTLSDADYELVGDGQYHNFTYYEYPEVTDWLMEKITKILKANLGNDEGLKTLAIGDIIKVEYSYYNGSGGTGYLTVEAIAAE